MRYSESDAFLSSGNLHTGESQRKDGSYMYRYIDSRSGKRQTIYATDLPELRRKEKQIAEDIDDHILTDQAVRKLTRCGITMSKMK